MTLDSKAIQRARNCFQDAMAWGCEPEDALGSAIVEYLALAAQGPVPVGWKLLPEVPTENMMNAGLYQSSHDSDYASVCQSYMDMWRSAPDEPALAPSVEWRPTHRHIKRGSVYRVVGKAQLQCSGNPALDDQPLVIYEGKDGMLWARGETEFNDGRFETVSPSEGGSR